MVYNTFLCQKENISVSSWKRPVRQKHSTRSWYFVYLRIFQLKGKHWGLKLNIWVVGNSTPVMSNVENSILSAVKVKLANYSIENRLVVSDVRMANLVRLMAVKQKVHFKTWQNTKESFSKSFILVEKVYFFENMLNKNETYLPSRVQSKHICHVTTMNRGYKSKPTM